jgi:phosphoribosyl 1,2-cyclic phosphodiesterase
MPLLFQTLASGSKGNAILVCSPKTRLLIDAGTSGRDMVRRLGSSCTEADQLDAILLTHEHQDHVNGAGVLSRRFGLPVYCSQGTYDNLPPGVGEFACRHQFTAGTSFSIGDIQIQPFAISHDACEPAGFVLQHNGCKLGICTDLGIATQLVRTRLRGCHGLVIEANHDVDMLMSGPYPWFLKQRIRGRHGHLSNADTCELLKSIHHSGLQAVVFAHLSETNNDPRLVQNGSAELRQSPEWECVRFEVGVQQHPIEAIELEAGC